MSYAVSGDTSRRSNVGIGDESRDTLLALMHEFGNSIASVTGCAQTLATKVDAPADLRRELAEVILAQSHRLKWLMDAAKAISASADDRQSRVVDLGSVVRSAAANAGAEAIVDEPAVAAGDQRHLTLAIEAAIAALSGNGTAAHLRRNTLTITSAARDLDFPSRRWKLDFAARLLEGEGCEIAIAAGTDGVVARLLFVTASDELRDA